MRKAIALRHVVTGVTTPIKAEETTSGPDARVLSVPAAGEALTVRLITHRKISVRPPLYDLMRSIASD